MQATVPAGKYVVAVSGGVDSMVLLDLLTKQSKVDLVVAHYEHGIRDDSDRDRQLVQQTANKLGLPFEFEHGNLGSDAGESLARSQRYAFLEKVRQKYAADAIITAHHQDDVLETAILNMIRGTGRLGLSSLRSSGSILRPLLEFTKADIYDYAKANGIVWHEDSTNDSDDYLRNYIRHNVIAKLGDEGKRYLLSYVKDAARINPEINRLLNQELKSHILTDGGVNRSWFISLPYNLSKEVMADWLRSNGINEFDARLIERLTVASKTYEAGKRCDINAAFLLKVNKKSLEIISRTPQNTDRRV